MTPIQQSLLIDGPPRARREDPPTAVAAGKAVKVNRRCAETLPFLRLCGPVTAFDLSERMRAADSHVYRWATPNVVSRRLLDLERRNLARRCGEVDGPFGRKVLTYQAVES